jgi:CheY-like chemotaxis protein
MNRFAAAPQRYVFLVHWNADEARERLAMLRRVGWRASGGPVGPAELKALRAEPPDVLAIDLSRLPSHGREVALAWRASKKTRHVPILFLGGEEAKVERARLALPDATYAEWSDVARALESAFATRGAEVVAPKDALAAGYSGTPLAKKLGVKPGGVVALVGAPKGFEAQLEPLPDGARTTRRAAAASLVLWFVKDRAALEADVESMAERAAAAPLWICWRKKTAAPNGDVGDREVRATALAAGLVDSKVCALDATWSGLRFTLRR